MVCIHYVKGGRPYDPGLRVVPQANKLVVFFFFRGGEAIEPSEMRIQNMFQICVKSAGSSAVKNEVIATAS